MYSQENDSEMFTDRFIKVPIRVYDKSHHDMTGKYGDMREAWTRINPMEIMEYREGFNKEEEVYVNLVFKNGTDFNCYMTMEAFETLLNSRDK